MIHMKKIILSFAVLSMLAFTGCSTPDGIDSDVSSLNSVTAANFDRIFDVSTDNSGLVRVTPIGEGVSKSVVTLGHGSDGEITLNPGESTTHNYPEGSYKFYVYIITNKRRTVLYTGVTNNLHRRLFEHKIKKNPNIKNIEIFFLIISTTFINNKSKKE